MPDASKQTPAAEDRRYHLVDALRGFALLNMAAYHFLYDVNIVYARAPDWYLRPGVRLWQQGICCSFILIAGLSFHWGRRHNLRRGLLLLGCGLAVTGVTMLFLPSETIRFGILSFMGCAVLLTLPLEKGLRRLPPLPALALCFLLFLLFRHAAGGTLGIGPLSVRLPAALYRFRALAPLGFPDPLFRSSDYFPLLPWYFLFLCGWNFGRIFSRSEKLQRAARLRVPFLSPAGRHTLPVYLLHQPLLMGLCMLIFE